MANEEQLAILKQGVDVWNKWRKLNPTKSIDLSDADLGGCNLKKAVLDEANLSRADLSETDLSQANFNIADLRRTNLSRANLRMATFYVSDLFEANFEQADLRRTVLDSAIFKETNLKDADFRSAYIGGTIFGNIDFSNVIGLEEVRYFEPSTIGIDTLQRSKGKIPTSFLRGCGLSDFEIESAKLYNPDLTNHEIDEILYKIHDLRANQSIQVSPLFISYSHVDGVFVDQLEESLNAKGIRFWRDIHDAKAGRLERQIEQAIRHNPTVLLVLSKNAMQSDWVQSEVRKARGLEKELGRDVLCPVALDDSWKEDGHWPERVMQQVMEYNILDFSQWRNPHIFEQMFSRLLDGLHLFYKG